MDWSGETALSIARLLREKKLGCVELTRRMLDRIREREPEPEINAFAAVTEEAALAGAREAQARIDRGEASPLTGVPMGIQDNLCTREAPATCGSEMLREFRPPYDATAAARLAAAGTVCLGKLNMDEMAMGSTTETSCFGPAKNPWSLDRTPGGSSGGSAAAVAAGEVFFALASDTGGSLRQPCSFCGVSGIKPTYGAVSRHGLVACAPSLDSVGPMARTIADCAAVLSLMGGRDRRDATSAARGAFDFSDCFGGEAAGLRIGLPRPYFDGELDNDVADRVLAAARTLESLGAVVEECDFAAAEYAEHVHDILSCAEAASELGRYDGVRYGLRRGAEAGLEEMYARSRSEGFGPEVRRRILLGTFFLSGGRWESHYLRAARARRRVAEELSGLLARYDLLLAPCAPTTAYRLGEMAENRRRSAKYTVPVNLAGLPAAAVPCGFDRDGMPVGLQLIGRAFGEPELVRTAHAFQLHTDFHRERPREAGQ